MLERGDQIGGWRVERLLGKGGYGEVYLCEQVGREFMKAAVKLLRPTRDQQELERFRREVETLGAQTHPNIPRLLDYDLNGCFFAMEYVPGESLADRLRTGPLPISDVLGIAAQIAQVLLHLHRQGISHRDVKPANVIVAQGGWVKLVDFGISLSHDATHRLTDGGLVGSFAYCPPEAFRVPGVPGESRDIYALGAMLYEAATGKDSFPYDNELMLKQKFDLDCLDAGDDVPPALRELVSDLTSRDPGDRITDMAACVARLEQLRRNLDEAARPRARESTADQKPEQGSDPRRWVGRATALMLAALGIMALGLTGVVGLTKLLLPDEPPTDLTVYVGGLTAETPVKLRLGDTEPVVDGLSFTFPFPENPATITLQAGSHCADAQCPGPDCEACCSTWRQEVDPNSLDGIQHLFVQATPPPQAPMRAVRLQAPVVAEGWAVTFDLGGRDGPRGEALDEHSRDYAEVEPGTYSLVASVGMCSEADRGCMGEGTCTEYCRSFTEDLVVPCGTQLLEHEVPLETPPRRPRASRDSARRAVGHSGTARSTTRLEDTASSSRSSSMSHSSSNREDYDDDDHYERAQPESPISEAVVHTIMTANRRIVKCFANAKWCTSDGYGDVVVAFAVDEDGAVTSASVTRGGNNSLNRCLPREIKELQFPPPSSNRAEELSYTFECR